MSDKQELIVDVNVAFNLKVQEYDKLIAEAEQQVAVLKAQRAAFIYQTNLDQVVAQAQKNQPVKEPEKVETEPVQE